ncbi:MAG TPA: NAD(P)/FAD-dependent oxidoreductase [Myxococcales bacterium]|nr:NAD(P)/FAD-dependent oxidoreductase [Myxococcales bacterium]
MVDFDAVIIGSGAGGLAAAVALAQSGQKVLVLEQHEVPGGWCHSFMLGGHRFSPGVHYLGELGHGGRLRAIYQGLGVSGDLVFCELNPDGYDHAVIGGRRFDFCKGKAELTRRLQESFPSERKGIAGYLDTCQRISDELDALMDIRGLGDVLRLPFKAPSVARWGLATARSLIGKHAHDPLLRAIFAAQSGDHGLPPSIAPAAVHASITAHYFDGGWYPRGGGFALPRAFVRALKRAGGELRLRTAVDRILVENGRAIGVRLKGGSEIRAGAVISNADPHATFGKLFDPADVPARLRRKLQRTKYSVSALSLFFAVDADLRKAGMDSGNLWWYANDDLDAIYRHGMTARLDDKIPGMFLTATTLKDPSKGDGRTHTLEAFAFVPHESFQKWAGSRMNERPADYLALKERLKARMLAAAGRALPGIDGHVTFSDLGTPLTNTAYCMSTDGNLYGTEKSRWQVGPWAWPVKGAYPGLLLCGASTLSHGVMGATLSGLAAASALLGVRVRELLTQRGPELVCVPSEHPEQWPAELRRREPQQEAA